MGSIGKKLTSSGQVSAAGKRAILKSYILVGDTGAASVSFTDGNGGTQLWGDSIKAQTAEGDDNAKHTFANGIEFLRDIYAVITNAPALYVEYEPME